MLSQLYTALRLGHGVIHRDNQSVIYRVGGDYLLVNGAGISTIDDGDVDRSIRHQETLPNPQRAIVP